MDATEKSENFISDNHFYVFVRLNDLAQPSFHIVPSSIVADEIKTSHQKWLNTPARDGSTHNPSSMRIFKDEENHFKDRWEILK